MRRFTPVGYKSVLEVRKRAAARWGPEAPAKLRALLYAGKLVASWPVKLELDPKSTISPDFWESREGERLFEARQFQLDAWPVPPPVFPEEDLDREIPDPTKEAAAQMVAARTARQARLATAEAGDPDTKQGTGNSSKSAERAQKRKENVLQFRSHRRPRGVTATQTPRVENEMRRMDRKKLAAMTGKQMEYAFNAARSTCTDCRERVLSENAGK